jgi:Zn-finger nucleic acid-binding protein
VTERSHAPSDACDTHWDSLDSRSRHDCHDGFLEPLYRVSCNSVDGRRFVATLLCSMNCIRCTMNLLKYEVPMPDGSSAWVYRCNAEQDCGIWYDAASLPSLHSRFAEREVREMLLTQTPPLDSVKTPPSCPRCASATIRLSEVVFARIVLDRCDRCHGVWVDRPEHSALMSAMSLWSPTTERRAPTHYRSAPMVSQLAPVGRWARCVRCSAEGKADDMMIGARGFLCVPCGIEAQQS